MTQVTDLALMSWQSNKETTRQRNVALVRDYYDGEQYVPLTNRQKEYLGFKVSGSKGNRSTGSIGSTGKWAVNYCRLVVAAVAERLKILTFTSTETNLAEFATTLWKAQRMAASAQRVHRAALRDGETFVIVDWDEENEAPRFTHNLRYVDAALGGTGAGCKAHYQNNNLDSEMLFASKRWTELVDANGRLQARRRANLYYPDRVEKYVIDGSQEANWMRRVEEGEEWPTPWVDSSGEPLGIPVVHFQNEDLRSELVDILPLQDALNKVWLDILAAADRAGFPIYIARGFKPTTDGNDPTDDADGGNWIKIAPGIWISTPNKDSTVEMLDAADLSGLSQIKDDLLMDVARVSDLPLSRIQSTKQVASEATLKQQETALVSKAGDRQITFGDAWETAMIIAARLETTFGAETILEGILNAEWKSAATRDEKEELERLKIKRDTLKIPLEQLWAEAGYTEEEIAKMVASEEFQASLATQRLFLDASTGNEG